MKTKLPKSTNKTILAFEELVRKDAVISFVRDYRRDLGIPEKGLEFTKDDEDQLTDKLYGPLLMNIGYLPKRIFPLPDNVASEYEGKVFRIINTLRAVVGGQGYRSNKMCSLFVFWFFFNKVYEPILHMSKGEDDLIKIDHLPSQLADYDREDMFLLQFCFDGFVEISKKYPIAVYVNPEITLNEMKDFLSKNWHLISSNSGEKSLYKGKRSKPKQRINDFIYENRGLKIDQIRLKLSSELGESYDNGNIGKILSLERKKRN